jgi:hypothetical protein
MPISVLIALIVSLAFQSCSYTEDILTNLSEWIGADRNSLAKPQTQNQEQLQQENSAIEILIKELKKGKTLDDQTVKDALAKLQKVSYSLYSEIRSYYEKGQLSNAAYLEVLKKKDDVSFDYIKPLIEKSPGIASPEVIKLIKEKNDWLPFSHLNVWLEAGKISKEQAVDLIKETMRYQVMQNLQSLITKYEFTSQEIINLIKEKFSELNFSDIEAILRDCIISKEQTAELINEKVEFVSIKDLQSLSTKYKFTDQEIINLIKTKFSELDFSDIEAEALLIDSKVTK